MSERLNRLKILSVLLAFHRTRYSLNFFSVLVQRYFHYPVLFFLVNESYFTALLLLVGYVTQVNWPIFFIIWLCFIEIFFPFTVYLIHFLNPSLKSLFFLNVHDLSHLNHQPPFIGCITEPIFKEKTAIYDIYVDCVINKTNPEIVFHSYNPVLRTIAKVTRHDRQRFKKRIT